MAEDKKYFDVVNELRRVKPYADIDGLKFFNSVQEGLEETRGLRLEGKSFYVIEDGKRVEYVFEGGIEDSNLKKVEVSAGGEVNIGSISTTQTAEQLNTLPDGLYFANGPGIYNISITNVADGVTSSGGKTTVAEGYNVSFTKKGSVWSLVNSVKVPAYDDASIKEDLSSLIVKIPKETITKKDSITAYNYGAVTHAFSGYIFNIGVQKDFNKLITYIKAGKNTAKPPTIVKVKLFEDSINGVLLCEKELTFTNLSSDVDTEISFEFPEISNLSNKNIVFQVWSNGFIYLINGNMTAVDWYYTANGGTNIQTGTNQQKPYYLQLFKTYYENELNKDLSADKVSDSTYPVKSIAVNQEFRKYDHSIKEEYVIENDIFRNYPPTKSTSLSTFQSWGQLFGKLKDFNRVGYIVNAFDDTLKPTWIKMIIREDSSSGQIIYNIQKEISVKLNEPLEVNFELPEIYTNPLDKNTYISFISNGRISAYSGGNDLPNLERVRYNTNGSDVVSTLVTSDYRLYVNLNLGSNKVVLSENSLKQVKNYLNLDIEVYNLLTSKVWLFPNLEYNIYNNNTIIPELGGDIDDLLLDFNGDVGQQFNRGFRYKSEANINKNISLSVFKGRNTVSTKSQNILSPTINNGSGITRKILIIGDSTVNGSNISTPLKTVFDTDVMNIELIGTQGSVGVKHEGRGGWTINDYATLGRKLYVVPVSNITIPPSVGAIYRQTAGNDFTVVEINITNGSGYFSVSRTTGSADLAVNGILTKISGSGDVTINYTNSTVTSQNPFYNSSVGGFDLTTYLTNTSQSLTDNDWIFFQLGINDVFGITTLSDAETKTDKMLNQYKLMRENIRIFNPNIKVGFIVTFPPANQDAFGYNYGVGQLSEVYKKVGLLTWQNKLINEFDNDISRNENTYLVSAHLNLDTQYNYPTTEVVVNSRNTKTITMQNNGVHPAPSGYAQIADMYAGIIKYFG